MIFSGVLLAAAFFSQCYAQKYNRLAAVPQRCVNASALENIKIDDVGHLNFEHGKMFNFTLEDGAVRNKDKFLDVSENSLVLNRAGSGDWSIENNILSHNGSASAGICMDSTPELYWGPDSQCKYKIPVTLGVATHGDGTFSLRTIDYSCVPEARYVLTPFSSKIFDMDMLVTFDFALTDGKVKGVDGKELIIDKDRRIVPVTSGEPVYPSDWQWTLQNDTLLLNGENHAVSCLDGEDEQYLLWAGDLPAGNSQKIACDLYEPVDLLVVQ